MPISIRLVLLTLPVLLWGLQSNAYAQDVPAQFVRDISCAGNWANSFWDIGTAACWECPRSAPKRTIFPVTGGWACEMPLHEKFRRAIGPRKPTGIFRTDCQRGWFLDIGKGGCYSCQGYRRTLHPITHPRACATTVGVVKARATRRGSPRCPEGAFQHLLSSRCYKCPAGSYRNANTGADPSKFGACTVCGGRGQKPCPITTLRKSCDAGLVENFVLGKCVESNDSLMRKFEANKARIRQRQERMIQVMAASDMPRAAVGGGGNAPPNEFQILFGSATDAQRRQLMRDLLQEQDGGMVTLVSGGSGSVVVGYGHAEGWAMRRGGVSGYRCRRIWNNAFTLGVSAGASGGWETGSWNSASYDDLAGETNGIAGGASLLVLNWVGGAHWSASSGDFAGITVMSGMGSVGVEVGVDWVHGWTGVADQDTPCEEITW